MTSPKQDLSRDETSGQAQQDVPSARERWEFERSLREREILIKEREQADRESELRLKQAEFQASRWRSPLVVAILGATVAALGNAGLSAVNGILQRRLEAQRSEDTRILEMIKTGDPTKAAVNLEFLVNAGLIGDSSRAAGLRRYLDSLPPGGGPALPSGVSGMGADGVIGPDDARPITTVDSNAPARLRSGAVGVLTIVRAGSGRHVQCTAFLVAETLALSTRACVDSAQSAQLRLVMNDGTGRDYPVRVPAPPEDSPPLSKQSS